MRGPYSDYAAPPVYVYPDVPRPGVHFSRTEIVQLGVAILALSVAFTLAYIRSDLFSFTRNPALFFAIIFPAALLAVATGVGLHEIMHKVVAERYGFWAEFRYNPRGLLFAIVLAGAIGLIYGAPGATMISGAVNREQNGRISAAGPASNLVICTALFAVFWFVARGAPSMFGGPVVLYLLQVLLQVSQINAVLAGFNLVPIMPLDGAKVFAWNKAAYAGLVAAAVGMVLLTLFYAVLL
ncbi:MAG: peptidase M50 [Methanobacteriota archaeon]|nr:MAG: peptidase M50 [Euryarchaeota archaeon]